MLDALEAKLPGLLASYRTEGEFRMAFAREADVIEDQAGEHSAWVAGGVASMLARHGRNLAKMEINGGRGWTGETRLANDTLAQLEQRARNANQIIRAHPDTPKAADAERLLDLIEAERGAPVASGQHRLLSGQVFVGLR